jgi:thiamine-phosphate pyrophosphorylase
MPVSPLATGLRGLYVIADSSLSDKNTRLHDKVAHAIQGGANLVQIRDKRELPNIEEIEAVADLCRQRQVPLLINDSIELALEVGASGVHLGQSDASLAEARQRLGKKAIIGITCHDRLDLAREAQAAGADYVAFGRFFPSQTKPEAPPANIEILTRARAELRLPIVAIGGITPDNGASLIRAGADMLAVIHGVFGQVDIEAAASAVSKLFEPQD